MPVILEEVDKPKHGHRSATPLVLIHDGGGTIVQYLMLGSLGRITYAISNPHFDSGIRPAGGIPQLAKEYAEAIPATIQEGPVILGGWSFGGIISLEIARILKGDGHISIVGLLMIDSCCPWSDSRLNTRCSMPSFRENTSKEMEDKVSRSFLNAIDMILSWDRPPAFKAPPAILIRAAASLPLVDSSKAPTVEDKWLGWSEYASLKFRSVVDVPEDHFSVFDDCRLENLTE